MVEQRPKMDCTIRKAEGKNSLKKYIINSY